jgi:hypothetical protein
MTYRVAPHVHFRAVHDEVVLLDARSDDYLGLNPTAATIWRTIVGGRPVAEAVAELVAGFGVPPEVAGHDATSFVDDLVARGLVERVAG